MNPIGASMLVLLAAIVLFGSRRWAVMGLMAGVLFLTQEQAVNLGGLNLFAMRFLETFGFIRVMSRREFLFSSLNKIDTTLVLLYIFATVVYCLRESDGQFYMIGMAVDALLCYFTFRGLIRDMEDLRWFLSSFMILLVPYAALVLFESVTHHNLFSIIGGGNMSWERNGRFRCFGSFRNPDLLGAVGISFLPLYVSLARIESQRRLGWMGIFLCLLVIYTTNSGGPLCAAGIGLVACGFWVLRLHMRKVRWTIVLSLAALALVMKAPIWYLIARIGDFTGGDAYTRANILDVAFQHLSLWWFAGMDAHGTANWVPDGSLITTGAMDIPNEFLSFGINSGLGAIVIFILLLKRAYSQIGAALRTARSSGHQDTELLLWGMGAVLTAHIANWFGITYFDQSYAIWFMELAAISSITADCLVSQAQANDDHPLADESDAPAVGSDGKLAVHCRSVGDMA